MRIALIFFSLLEAGIWTILSPASSFGSDWTQFRGPNGQGRSSQSGLPVQWSEREGIVWKVPIEGLGWSSPVIDGDRIWLTTATQGGHSLRAICVAGGSGKADWNVEVFAPQTPVPINPKNSYASPSPIIERGRLYVHFGAMGTACLEADSGKVLWRNSDLVIDHKEGPGSSPILFDNLLIVSCDGQDRQFVAALDQRTGKTVWQTKRSIPVLKRPDFRKAFSTPALINVGGKTQVISTGADQVESYDPRTGREIWRVQYAGFSGVPVPIVAPNRVFIVTDFTRPELWEIRTDGQGDVTNTHVLWKLVRQVGASPSPVLLDGRLYLVTDQGVATCVDVSSHKSSHKVLWQHRLGGAGQFSASPVALGGMVYFCSEQGKTTVVRPGDQYQAIAVNELAGRIFATPAVMGSALILRTDTHLYRIEDATAGRTTSAEGFSAPKPRN